MPGDLLRFRRTYPAGELGTLSRLLGCVNAVAFGRWRRGTLQIVRVSGNRRDADPVEVTFIAWHSPVGFAFRWVHAGTVYESQSPPAAVFTLDDLGQELPAVDPEIPF